MEVPVLQISANTRAAKQRPRLTRLSILFALLAVAGGGLAAIILLPAWLPAISNSLSGASPKAFWYLSRASAVISYLLLWASMALGLGITNRLAFLWPGAPTTYSLHQYTGLLGLGFAALHPLLLLGDRYINYTFVQLLVPFAGENYRQFGVGIGQIGIYLLALVGLSYYVRKRITPRRWRMIHTLSFATFLLVLIHGVISGTDSTGAWAVVMYWLSCGSLLFLTVYRIVRRRYATVAVAR